MRAVIPDLFLQAKPDQAGGIPASMTIAIGARVMLRRNIAVDVGLANAQFARWAVCWALTSAGG